MAEAAIRDVIRSAYFEGVYLEQNEEKVTAGFHPQFRMLVKKENDLAEVSAPELLASVRTRREKDPALFEAALSCEVPTVAVEGTAAVARIEIYREDVHWFTDFFSLYLFPDGWKVVAKIYHAHPTG